MSKSTWDPSQIERISHVADMQLKAIITIIIIETVITL